LEYRKALAIDPKQSSLHTALGQAYLHSGKIQEAVAEFYRELDVDSSAELAWLGLAEVALKQEQSAAAIEAVAKAWEISPEILVRQREFPTVELTPAGVKAAVAEISASAENPSKHFLLSALHSISAENGEADEQSRALQNDLASWRRSHAGTAVPC